MGQKNPIWNRDEIVLALDFYIRHQNKIPSKASREIHNLSNTIRLASPVPEGLRSKTFRNVNGVYMKLMNFRRLDPSYQGSGLKRGGLTEKNIWNELAGDAAMCLKEAEAIIQRTQVR